MVNLPIITCNILERREAACDDLAELPVLYTFRQIVVTVEKTYTGLIPGLRELGFFGLAPNTIIEVLM